MQQGNRDLDPFMIDPKRLLNYIAELELEVDRLRRQRQFVEKEERETLGQILRLCTAPNEGDSLPTLAEVDRVARRMSGLCRDLHEPPGYHPAFDQVVAIALRPLVEQEFRAQRRLAGDTEITLRLELEIEHVEWFPARLRHVLDNLICNALSHRDPDKDERWVALGVRATPEHYEFRLSDNGIGTHPDNLEQVDHLFHRSAPTRAAGLGIGLAVAKLLVQQSGGELKAESVQGGGSTLVVTLPRYAVDDYLI